MFVKDYFSLVYYKDYMFVVGVEDFNLLLDVSVFLLECEYCMIGYVLSVCYLNCLSCINLFEVVSLYILLSMVEY